MPNSPYINHFVSADTMIPSYANPQDLNRYSYVTNNPIRYADPTGHMEVENKDMQHNHGPMNCSKYPQYCSNGKKKSADELAKMRNKSNDGDNILHPIKSKETCDDCGMDALEGVLHVAEGLAFAGVSIVALGAVLATGPEGIIAAPFFIATTLVGINFAMFGAQELQHAATNGTSGKPDPIPLVHLVFPNFRK
jgi:hypothetical protein